MLCGDGARTDDAIPATMPPNRESATRKRTSRARGDFFSDMFRIPSMSKFTFDVVPYKWKEIGKLAGEKFRRCSMHHGLGEPSL